MRRDTLIGSNYNGEQGTVTTLLGIPCLSSIGKLDSPDSPRDSTHLLIISKISIRYPAQVIPATSRFVP